MEIKPRIGRYTVYACDYLKQDSDVMLGGGTDETELLQTILDKAEEWGGLVLEVDGAILTRGFAVHSNTTIHCANQSCGFFLKDGAAQPLVRNAHLSYLNMHDKNIQLLGGTYNLNSPGQDRAEVPVIPAEGEENLLTAWLMGMKFLGVSGLTMRDMRLVNQRIFAGLFANWEHIVVENFAIDLPDNRDAQNQDGLHFWGPGRDLSIRNIRGCSGDDFLALAPDEHDFKSDITDVLIDGVYLENADQGIRMLSRGPGKLDRVTVRNVYGTYKSCGFFINPAFGKDLGDCEGNYGSITLENIQLRQTYHKYAQHAHAFLFRVGGRMQSLTLKNIQAIEPNDARPLVDISHIYGHWSRTGSCVDIANLTVDGLEILNREGTVDPTDYISVDGKVDHLTVRNVLVNRDGHPAADRLVAVKEAGRVKSLMISQVQATGIDSVLDLQGGTVEHVFADGVFLNDEEVLG